MIRAIAIALLLVGSAVPFQHIGNAYESVVQIHAERGWGSGNYLGGGSLDTSKLRWYTIEVVAEQGSTKRTWRQSVVAQYGRFE